MDNQTLYESVSKHYSAHASSSQQTEAYGKSVAKSFGYTEEELTGIPTESNLGLSCGNPIAIASLKEGETIIDFGSGAGFDVFLASKKVGPNGHAIGVDMNRDMLALAEKNKQKAGASAGNVSFVEAAITSIPLEDGIADCIISNCVINLVPESDKPKVFKEMARLLKPGGRVAVSDILAKKPLPDAVKKHIALYAGCISGASLVSQYENYLADAGFSNVFLTDTHSDLNIYTDTMPDGTKKIKSPKREEVERSCSSQPTQKSCCTKKLESKCYKNEAAKTECHVTEIAKPDYVLGLEDLESALSQFDVNEHAGSYKIYAIKI